MLWPAAPADDGGWQAFEAEAPPQTVQDNRKLDESAQLPILGPTVSMIMPAHAEWSLQGGANPAGASVGEAAIVAVDWSRPREEVSRDIAAAVRRDGFFYLVNHGVDPELIARTMELGRQFFEHRREARHKDLERIRVNLCERPMLKCARGYTDLFTEALNPEQAPDAKEAFDYSLAPADGALKRGEVHLGQNLWPDGLLAPPGFRDGCEEYIETMYELSRRVLHALCMGVGVPEADVESLFETPLVVNRLLRYPPQPEQTESQGMGAGSHVDYGALTLIVEDIAGLEVQRPGDPHGPWLRVPHLEGALIINTGFMLERLTNGLLPATRHRVINASKVQDRYSLAMFLDPNPDAQIGPLPSMLSGKAPRYETCTAGHKGVRFGY